MTGELILHVITSFILKVVLRKVWRRGFRRSRTKLYHWYGSPIRDELQLSSVYTIAHFQPCYRVLPKYIYIKSTKWFIKVQGWSSELDFFHFLHGEESCMKFLFGPGCVKVDWPLFRQGLILIVMGLLLQLRNEMEPSFGSGLHYVWKERPFCYVWNGAPISIPGTMYKSFKRNSPFPSVYLYKWQIFAIILTS
jgi:hypothetical protein